MTSDEWGDVIRVVNEAGTGKIRLSKPLGAGGQGSVFLGTYEGRDSAIKLFRPGTEIRRVQREIQLLTSSPHPNIVRILGYEAVTIDTVEVYVVAYELIQGRDVSQQIQEATEQCSCRDVCTMGAQIADALHSLWRLGYRIVHRDIKPANIMKATPDRYVLVDFGLARHLDLSNLTLPGAIPGTIGYMSPEQAAGRKNLTIHSDIFSLGLTLFEMAAKKHPYHYNQQLIGQAGPINLRNERPDFPVELVETVEACLSTLPAMRPRNLTERFQQIQRMTSCL